MITATITSEGLTLREKADAKSKKIDELQRGDKLQVYQISINGNWVHVSVLKTKTGIGEGQRGWVHKDYVCFDNPVQPGPGRVEPIGRDWTWPVLAAIGALVVAAVIAVRWLA